MVDGNNTVTTETPAPSDAATLTTGMFRRHRFKLGELRRQMIRNRRFREAVDSDMVVGRAPDYVGVGAQRAGTSRWHKLLTAHPDVVEVTDPSGRIVKEIHWFDQPLSEELDARDGAYNAWFQAPVEKTVGEWTPRYLYDLWPIDRLRQVCPDTKLLVLLREPVGRMVSALQFYEQRGIRLDRDSLRESMWRGLYGPQMEFLLDRWPREQVYVALYEQCSANPQAELARLYEFLDLDPSFVPEGMDRRVNGSAKLPIDGSLLNSARSLYEADRSKLEAILPDIDFTLWN